MNRDEIIRKAKAILAMAQGGSENEMLVAAQKLQAFLAKHQLSLADLKEENTGVEFLEIPGKYNEGWRRTCYNAAAKMFMCEYFFVPTGNKTQAITHCFVGQPHNLAIVGEIGGYFESTINRKANEGVKTSSIERGDHTGRNQYIRSFRLQASRRVYSRVLELVAQAKDGTWVDTDTGSTLPAILAVYEQADSDNSAWLASQGYTLNTVEDRSTVTNLSAAQDGRKAGDNISLNTQIRRESQDGFLLPSS